MKYNKQAGFTLIEVALVMTVLVVAYFSFMYMFGDDSSDGVKRPINLGGVVYHWKTIDSGYNSITSVNHREK